MDELEDIVDEESGEEQVILYGAFEEYSNIQKYLEDNGFEIISSEFERIPNDVKEVTPEQRAAIEKLLEKNRRRRRRAECVPQHEGRGLILLPLQKNITLRRK